MWARGGSGRLAGALLGMLLAVGPASRLEGQELTLTPVVFALNDGRTVDAEQGTLSVPEDRSVEGGVMVTLPVVRFVGLPGAGGSPTILLEGGPGSSGIAAARGGRYELIETLRAFGDVVVLDQRGVGAALPRVECPVGADHANDLAMSRETWAEALAKPAARCARVLRRDGVDPGAYNTRETADDIESLRIALGADRVVLWAQSYGTQVALTMLRRHGERVDRVMLHGVLPHDGFVALPATTDKILAKLGRKARNLRSASTRSADMIGDLEAALAALAAQAMLVSVADPATGATIEVRLSDFEMAFVINFLVLGDRGLMSRLPRWLRLAATGDFAPFARLGLSLRRFDPPPILMTVGCTTPESAKRAAKAERQAERSLLGLLPRLGEVCAPWDVEAFDAEFLEPVVSDVPALLVAGTLDSVTTLADAKAVARGLANSQLLTLVGGTHSDTVSGDPRIVDAIEAFMSGSAIPKRRLVLPPWEFAPLPSAR